MWNVDTQMSSIILFWFNIHILFSKRILYSTLEMASTYISCTRLTSNAQFRMLFLNHPPVKEDSIFHILISHHIYLDIPALICLSFHLLLYTLHAKHHLYVAACLRLNTVASKMQFKTCHLTKYSCFLCSLLWLFNINFQVSSVYMWVEQLKFILCFARFIFYQLIF